MHMHTHTHTHTHNTQHTNTQHTQHTHTHTNIHTHTHTHKHPHTHTHTQVVAPVRATCAQVLGVVVRVMCVEHVDHVMEVLLTLAGQKQWEVRHASLMGMQHLLAARTVSRRVYVGG